MSIYLSVLFFIELIKVIADQYECFLFQKT